MNINARDESLESTTTERLATEHSTSGSSLSRWVSGPSWNDPFADGEAWWTEESPMRRQTDRQSDTGASPADSTETTQGMPATGRPRGNTSTSAASGWARYAGELAADNTASDRQANQRGDGADRRDSSAGVPVSPPADGLIALEHAPRRQPSPFAVGSGERPERVWLRMAESLAHHQMFEIGSVSSARTVSNSTPAPLDVVPSLDVSAVPRTRDGGDTSNTSESGESPTSGDDHGTSVNVSWWTSLLAGCAAVFVLRRRSATRRIERGGNATTPQPSDPEER